MRHGVGSRFPLKMEPRADGCDSGRMSVAFSLAWLKLPLGLLQTGVDLHRKVRGPCASTKVEPVNDRPSPRSVLVRARPNEHPSFRCDRAASRLQHIESGHRAGFRRQLATAGQFPFKAKEFVPMLSEHGTDLVLGRAPQAPEVMLDDTVQTRPGRLRPQ